MSKVFFDVSLSLDGCLAGPHAGPDRALGDGGAALHEWLYSTATFRASLGESGGETGHDDALVKAAFDRAGAYVMGRRMFDEGENRWPEAPPFQAPVFVLTRHTREPWVRDGGTTFHFLTCSVHEALARARAAARGRDVRIAGGADTIQQFLAADLVDDFTLHTAPRLLGPGVRLFDDFVAEHPTEVVAASHSERAAHVHYRIVRDGGAR